MKTRLSKLFFFLLVFLTGGLILHSISLDWPSLRQEQLIFATVGQDHLTLSNEQSSYEIQRASEHFSDVILGWTIEPGFSKELELETGRKFTFTGQRQEKQNLIFKLETKESEDSKLFLQVLQKRLDAYNAATHGGYRLVTLGITPMEVEVSKNKFMLGALLLLALSELAFIFVFEYVRKNRNRWPWSN
jgi:hypothetical protein